MWEGLVSGGFGSFRFLVTTLHVNICHQDLYLLDGCKLDIKTRPNQFLLMSGYCLKIHSCELVVCYVDVQTSTILAQQQFLLSRVNASYLVWHVKGMTELLPAQTQIKEIDNVFLGNVPNHMVASQDQAGRMTKNPFHFRHNNISKIALSIDGQTVSPGVLSIDTSSKDAKDADFQLLGAS